MMIIMIIMIITVVVVLLLPLLEMLKERVIQVLLRPLKNLLRSYWVNRALLLLLKLREWGLKSVKTPQITQRQW